MWTAHASPGAYTHLAHPHGVLHTLHSHAGRLWGTCGGWGLPGVRHLGCGVSGLESVLSPSCWMNWDFSLKTHFPVLTILSGGNPISHMGTSWLDSLLCPLPLSQGSLGFFGFVSQSFLPFPGDDHFLLGQLLQCQFWIVCVSL